MKDHDRNRIELNSFDQIPDVLAALEKRNIPYYVEAVAQQSGDIKVFILRGAILKELVPKFN